MLDNDQIYRLAQAAVITIPSAVAVVGSVWAVARHAYLAAKSRNETAPERSRAKIAAMQAREQIVNSQNYQSRLAEKERRLKIFLDRRTQLNSDLLKLPKEQRPYYNIGDYLDEVVGSISDFEDLLGKELRL